VGVVYQLTFLFGLVLLAIFITVFVFAVSLLGRAMEAAATVERGKVEERKENNIKEMSDIRKDIQKAEKKGELPKGLRRKLEKLEERNREFDNELSKIRKAPELLTVKGGVIYPCVYIIWGLILSGTASYLSTIKDFNVFTPLFIWLLGLSAIGYSIYRLCKSLRVIENVAVTSEEAWITKTVEAFKIAQKELEEEKKPILELMFMDNSPPYSVEAESEISIKCRINVIRGDSARNVCVIFIAPPDFSFPNTPTGPTPLAKYSGYASTLIELGDMRRPIKRTGKVTLKAPHEVKKYTAAYRVFCDGFDSDFIEFDITVEEQELPF